MSIIVGAAIDPGFGIAVRILLSFQEENESAAVSKGIRDMQKVSNATARAKRFICDLLWVIGLRVS
jgi:hypothetical protein